MSVETVNVVREMVTFIAANPPVIISRSGGVRAVVRTGTGIFRVELEQKLPINATPANSPGACLQHSVNGPFFTGCTPEATAGVNQGDVVLSTYAIGGSLADINQRVDLAILAYPNQA